MLVFLVELQSISCESVRGRHGTSFAGIRDYNSVHGLRDFHCATNQAAKQIGDPQGILRLSIGGGEHLPVTMNYVVVRGKIGQCIELLEKALVALRECPE